MAFRADLHCHTTCSDGSFTPEEVLILAKERELGGISITDHDNIDAYPAAVIAAQNLGLELISGVELSAMHRGVSVHILAYGFSLHSMAIQSFCTRHQARRSQRMKDLLLLLNKHGMSIEEEDLYASRSSLRGIGRPHLAKALVNKGYVKSTQEAFNRFLGDGKPCYTPGQTFSVEETLSIIKQANGLAIIAHPHLIKQQKIVNDLLAMPFDGLEGYYAQFPLAQNSRWLEVAKQKNWLVLGGSDFHGEAKPTLKLGSSWTPESTFRAVQQLFLENNRTTQEN